MRGHLPSSFVHGMYMKQFRCVAGWPWEAARCRLYYVVVDYCNKWVELTATSCQVRACHAPAFCWRSLLVFSLARYSISLYRDEVFCRDH